MQLEHLLHLHADLKDPVNVGTTAFGTRQIVDVVGGSFEGPRLKGTVLPSGGDWVTIGSDGSARLDVRATLETDDGAVIYVQYPGVMVINETMMNAMASGGETQFGDTEFFTQPRCETGHEDYAWLNTVVALGQGRLVPNGVEYNISRVVN